MTRVFSLFVSRREDWKRVGRVFRASVPEADYSGWVFEHVAPEGATWGDPGYDLELLGFLVSRQVGLVVEVYDDHRFASLHTLMTQSYVKEADDGKRVFLPTGYWATFLPEYAGSGKAERLRLYAHEAMPAMRIVQDLLHNPRPMLETAMDRKDLE